MKQAIDSSNQDLELCFRRLGLEHPLNQNRNQVPSFAAVDCRSGTQHALFVLSLIMRP